MRSAEIGRRCTNTSEAGNITPIWIKVVNEAGAVAITHEEISIRRESGVGGVVFAEIRILRGHRIRTKAA